MFYQMTSSSSCRIWDCSTLETPLNDCEIFKEKIRQSLHKKRSSALASTLLAKQKPQAIIFYCTRTAQTHTLTGGQWGRGSRKRRPYDLLDFFTKAISASWNKKPKVSSDLRSQDYLIQNVQCLKVLYVLLNFAQSLNHN